jgi:D-cysteine desulfhydrase family pyridoxal phosphate-dependent enzyme
MIPRLLLANLPTPIEAMPRLSNALGGPRLWIKRDDLTGAGMGGNKVRKLEYLLAEAQANGAKTLITTGAAQSNHCRQTAALAARLGFKCKLVLVGDTVELIDGNLILDQMFRAEIIWARKSDRDAVLKQVFEQSWKAGERPYLIPLGGSTPIGTLGYLRAFEEFREQNCPVNWIILASSSGGTQAGLELGKRLTNWDGKILGINVGSDEPDLSLKISTLCNEAAFREAIESKCNVDEIILNGDYCAAGYGNPTGLELEAIRLFSNKEGILLDPVYTARAAAAMIDLIRTGFFTSTDSLLFWHTGGIPALFSEKYASLLREKT